MPKISVVMPVYHTNPIHLHQAIDSVLNQSYTDFEFIILNDSPQNNTIKQIISTYDDSRIIYHETTGNQGIAKSYNQLLELASSKYIALMNHDDICRKNRLKKQYEYLEKHKDVGLVGTGYKKFGEINRFKTVVNPQDDATIRSMLLFKSSIHHPTIMFRRDIAIDHKIRYNENFISLNDRQFYYDFSKFTKLANMKDILYDYRFHKDMTSKLQKPKIKEERQAFHKLWFAYNRIDLTPEEIDAFDNYASYGRCRIKDKHILKNIQIVLEKLVQENAHKNFLPQKEFEGVCAKYLVKRCLNAGWYGNICSKDIIKQTTLPVKTKPLLSVLNFVNRWRFAS